MVSLKIKKTLFPQIYHLEILNQITLAHDKTSVIIVAAIQYI